MQDSGWRRSHGPHIDRAYRIIRSLAMYSAHEAQEAEEELEAELDHLRSTLSSSLVGHIDAVLEDKNLNLEDEDSSIDIHMLMRLKQDAEQLCC